MTTPTFGAPAPQPEGDLAAPNATTAVAGGTLAAPRVLTAGAEGELAAPRTLTALPAQGLAPLEVLVPPEE